MEHTNFPQRKHIRLPNFDYSSHAVYYLTVCTKDRKPLLSNISQSSDGEVTVQFTCQGTVVDQVIRRIPEVYESITLISYVIMPDHIHLIVGIGIHDDPKNKSSAEKSISIPTIIKSLKRVSNKETGKNLWQNRYHDHVIRSMDELFTKIQYIETNPLRYLLRSE